MLLASRRRGSRRLDGVGGSTELVRGDMRHHRRLAGGMSGVASGSGQLSCSSHGLATRGTRLRHLDLAACPCPDVLDGLSGSWIRWLHRLKAMQNMLRAHRRPQRQEAMVGISQRSTAADGDEAGGRGPWGGSRFCHEGGRVLCASVDAEQVTDPVARCCCRDALSLGIGVVRACAEFEEHADDPALLLFGGVRAGIARARGLNGEVQRGRTTLVLEERIGTVADECLDGLSGASPNGSMDGSNATVVECVGIGAVLDEIDDDLPLSTGIPAPVGGVVQRFGSPSVPRTNSRAACDEHLNDFWLMRGRCDVECRVTSIDVMANRHEEVSVWASAAGTDLNWTCCEIGGCVQSLRNIAMIPGSDCTKQHK